MNKNNIFIYKWLEYLNPLVAVELAELVERHPSRVNMCQELGDIIAGKAGKDAELKHNKNPFYLLLFSK